LLAKVLEHGAVVLGIFLPIEITRFHHLRCGSARARLLFGAFLYHGLHLLRIELSVSPPFLLVSSLYNNNGWCFNTPDRSTSLVPSGIFFLLFRCRVLNIIPPSSLVVALWRVNCFRSLLPRSFARGALLSHSVLVLVRCCRRSGCWYGVLAGEAIRGWAVSFVRVPSRLGPPKAITQGLHRAPRRRGQDSLN